MNAPRGKPLAMPLAMVMMSGSTSYASMANIFPLRPNPLWTSSTMSRIPRASRISLTLPRYPAGSGMMPPSPMIGSMMNAATSSLVSYLMMSSTVSAQASEQEPEHIRHRYGSGVGANA